MPAVEIIPLNSNSILPANLIWGINHTWIVADCPNNCQIIIYIEIFVNSLFFQSSPTIITQSIHVVYCHPTTKRSQFKRENPAPGDPGVGEIRVTKPPPVSPLPTMECGTRRWGFASLHNNLLWIGGTSVFSVCWGDCLLATIIHGQCLQRAR